MTELQTKLQELRELVEDETVTCPTCGGRGWSVDIESHGDTVSASNSPCSCCSSGRIPDPAYAPLLEVVRAPCEKFGRPHWHQEVYYRSKDNCHRYLTRSWDELPKGALAGALWVAYPRNDYLITVAWNAENIDLGACDMLIEALKEKAK